MSEQEILSSPEKFSDERELYLPYIDEHLFVVEKPPGIHTVGEEPSLEYKLKSRYPALIKLQDAGLIQRLDFETTGIICGGITEQIQTDLRYSLSIGKLSKSYLVVVEGGCSNGGVVEGYLYSRYRGSAKVSMQPKPSKRAQFSKSIILPIQSFGGFSLVRVDCSIARRHQVRVHMASIGHPLVGDVLYGAKSKLSDIGLGDHRSSFILIAKSLSFAHPVTEQKLTFHASLTAEQLLHRIQSGCAAI